MGLHKGEDTAYYLSRGFRVVAIEADPDLVSFCQDKFSKAIESGDLVIIHGAVVDDDNQKFVKFYKNKKKSDWGTIIESFADRNTKYGAKSVEIAVPVVDFKDLFKNFDCPHYIKIDIEGSDIFCLTRLLSTRCRPKYISIESEKIDFIKLIQELNLLESLGYTKFFIQQQATIYKSAVPLNSSEGTYVDQTFVKGMSGPFGSDLGSNWLSKQDAVDAYKKIFKSYKYFGDNSVLIKFPLAKYILFTVSKLVGKPLPGWYDTHAQLE